MTYRSSIRRCPACDSPMRARPVADDVTLDVCDVCGGILLDFFDGEPSNLARAVHEELGREPRAALETHPPRCPDCEEAMVDHRYMESGPSVKRCSGCLALFATPAELGALARYHEQDPDEPEATGVKRLLQLLREWMD